MFKRISNFITIVGLALSPFTTLAAYENKSTYVGEDATSRAVNTEFWQNQSVTHTDLPVNAPGWVTMNDGGKESMAAKTGKPEIPIYASVVYSSEWTTSNKPIGMYSLGKSEPFTMSSMLSPATPTVDATNGGAYFDGKYLITRHTTVKVLIATVDIITHEVYDAETWERLSTVTAATKANLAYSMTYDKKDGLMYGCFKTATGTGYVYGTLDYKKALRSEIKTWTFPLTGMAFTNDGRLIGIDPQGALYSVDQPTGELTLIGETGKPSKYITSGCIDPRTGAYYYVACNDDADGGAILYTIDVKTAKAEKVCDIEGRKQLTGMFIPEDPASDKAPAAVTGLAVNFDKNDLMGSVSFRCPDHTYDGSTASDKLTYTVKVNGETAATGVTAWGMDVNADVAVAKPGMYEFSVTVANEAGDSPRMRTKKYVGDDAPNAVKTVTMTQADNRFNVTWTPSEGSANGAWFNQEEVTYNVVRYPDETTVASGLKVCEYSEPQPITEALTYYHYDVIPVYGLAQGKATSSNSIALGYIEPPYSETFETEEAQQPFTVIDTDNDNKTWKWYKSSKAMRCEYSTSKAKDDWLITPGIKMESGKAYKLTFKTWGNSKTTIENLEVKMGASPTPEAMNRAVIDSTMVIGAASSAKITAEQIVVAPGSGVYYIGFHAVSPAKRSYLYVSDIELSADISAASPDGVTDLTITPAADGTLNARLEFTAPTITLAGETLTTLSKIEVWRNSELATTIEKPEVGSKLSVTDAVPAAALYTYSIIAFNAEGSGKAVEAKAYVGINRPGTVTDVNLTETENTGEVELSWSAPTTDADGNPMNPALVTYDILLADRTTVKADVNGTSCTIQAVKPGESQRFVQYFVWAKTSAGGSKSAVGSQPVSAGEPYKLPVAESASDCKPATIWMVDAPVGYGTWGFASDATIPGSQDGDNGYFLYQSKSNGDAARLLSGKIDLSGENPALTFYYYAVPDYKNQIDVQIRQKGGEFSTLRTLTVGESGELGWRYESVPLDGYAGKVVEIGFLATTKSHTALQIDNIAVNSRAKTDLAAVAVNVPTTFKPGEARSVSVMVSNVGMNDVEQYTLRLYRNNECVLTKKCDAIAAGTVATMKLWDAPSISNILRLEYKATVECENDANEANNESPVAVAQLAVPSYPTVNNLTGTQAAGALVLNWGVPTLNGGSGRMTDNVDEYTAFSIGLPHSAVSNDNVGGWTMTDVDGGDSTYGISNGKGGHYEFANDVAPKAYMVFSYSEAGVTSPNWKGHDGSDKCFVAFADRDKKNDDWLISPELTGDAQTVTFVARSITKSYGGESFEFLTSTMGKATENFTAVRQYSQIEAQWTSYSFDIPAGTKYFAIRCISEDQLALMVDDISFEAASPYAYLEIEGYNVYRDGKKLNVSPISEPTYEDVNATGLKNAEYQVSVVYKQGESGLSNIYTLQTTGMDDINWGEIPIIRGEEGCVTIANAKGLRVSVSAIDGKTLFYAQAAPSDEVRVAVTSGVYAVTAGNVTEKIVVK